MPEELTKQEENEQYPSHVNVLPVKDLVIFPQNVIPLLIGRESSKKSVNKSIESNRLLAVVTQKDPNIEEVSEDNLHDIGCLVSIIRVVNMPNDKIKILIQGIKRVKIDSFNIDTESEDGISADISVLDENDREYSEPEDIALIRSTKDSLIDSVGLGKAMLPDVLKHINQLDHPGQIADLIAINLSLSTKDNQDILSTIDPIKRLEKIKKLLDTELSLLELQQSISNKTRGEIDKSQKEYFLREQLKSIKKELGEDDQASDEIESFKTAIEKKRMPADIKKDTLKEISRLSKMHPDSMEANVVRTYIEWMKDLPWKKYSNKKIDIQTAKDILDGDHYGLKDVKERILEYLAVSQLHTKNKKRDMKSPIICLVGPPGVGKTSMGASIAKAMGSKYQRISLGGMKDEAEIRGHRRTYIGALPGKIIQSIKKAGVSDPTIILDEIDKVGADFRGDPYSALLEVLDPQQNKSFTDHYIGVPYDLSKVTFITTANSLDSIPAPLFDRMEVIPISGYSLNEKLNIAKKYLLPQQKLENALDNLKIKIEDKELKKIIGEYTRESGVRGLERVIAKIFRKIALEVTTKDTKEFNITNDSLTKYLGAPKIKRDKGMKQNQVGVVTGLAWTPVGGEILNIETIKYPGKGKMIVTGKLGEVMKESSNAAMSYIKSIAKEQNIDEQQFNVSDVHIHFPAAAIPKDGPSAGITITTALLSLFTNRKVRKEVAMTGEITITGKVLAIGGLKEKLLSVKRYDIDTVIIPEENTPDIKEFDKEVTNGINIIPIKHYNEIIDIALEK